MRSFSYKVKDPNGIHARPAGLLVKTASDFDSEITIEHKGNTANAKKIFSLMSLGVKQGEEIVINTLGNDENEAMAAMEIFIKQNL